MVRTAMHGRDTPRVPIGDVLIKRCSLPEHCDNERGWERVGIHFIFVDEDLFFRLKKKKKNVNMRKTKMYI